MYYSEGIHDLQMDDFHDFPAILPRANPAWLIRFAARCENAGDLMIHQTSRPSLRKPFLRGLQEL